MAEAVNTSGTQVATPEAFWLVWLRHQCRTEKRATVIVFGLGALLFFPYLGTLGLWDCWEPHYAEVAREMIVRDDYVYPHWEGAYFFSKPIFPLWLMAAGLLVVGAESPPAGEALGSLAEWGVRAPFALIAIMALYAVYRLGTQLRDRSVGLLAVVVLGSSAQFVFIGKQAITDMPLVGLTTIAFAFFAAAVFHNEGDKTQRRHQGVAAVAILLSVWPQLAILGRELSGVDAWLALSGTALLALGLALLVFFWGSHQDALLVGFYICVGFAALSKGLAVLALVGPTVLLYMIIAWDFGLLVRSRVLVGGLIFLLVASPWYVVLSLFGGRDDEGKTFVTRFWLHDNFNRVGRGVHGDRAGMGYFLEQLAYGMFPWVAVVPSALGFAVSDAHEERSLGQKRLLLFILIWGLWTYLFMSMSQTKFHHYIFPAVPALAVLVAFWLSWVAEDPTARLRGFGLILVAAVFAVVARDLINDPQLLVNLFTYKYDRDYPRELRPRVFLACLVGATSIALIYFGLRRQKAQILFSFLGMGVLFGVWVSHYHFNMLSPHWSQAHLFKTFYEERRPGEPIYAYQLNWRGETFYSRNQIVQVKDTGANERMRRLVDRPGRAFIITEQSRYYTLKNLLSSNARSKIRILDRSNNKFYLCLVDD